MKRRPDWIGDAQRKDDLERRRWEDLQSRQPGSRVTRPEPPRKRAKKFKDMTQEELEALRVEIIAARETAEAVSAETRSPKFQAMVARMREERQAAFKDLNGVLLEVTDALSQKFAGIEADVDAYDRNDDEFQLCFDGTHLLWSQMRHGGKKWALVKNAPLRIRLAVPFYLHALLSALSARSWIAPQPA